MTFGAVNQLRLDPLGALEFTKMTNAPEGTGPTLKLVPVSCVYGDPETV